MYYPETFFNMNILKNILEEYNWPLEYTLQETNGGDVIIIFPKCRIVISEGFESNMYAYFPNVEIGRSNIQSNLKIFDAIEVLKPIRELTEGFVEPKGLVKNLEVEPSQEKVKQGLHNICILLQTYLLPCIEGDFSWVEDYYKKHPDMLL
jgi:hypothetical protein